MVTAKVNTGTAPATAKVHMTMTALDSIPGVGICLSQHLYQLPLSVLHDASPFPHSHPLSQTERPGVSLVLEILLMVSLLASLSFFLT